MMASNFHHHEFSGSLGKPVSKQIQAMVDTALSPSRTAISEIIENTSARKMVLAAFEPAMNSLSRELIKTIRGPMVTLRTHSVIAAPLNFNSFAALKVGDAFARQLSAVVFSGVTEPIRTQAKMPQVQAGKTCNPPVFTEDELDRIAEEAFAGHPDLLKELDSDLALSALSDTQKKMLIWSFGLFILFGTTLFVAWGIHDEQIAQIGQFGGSSYAAYQLIKVIRNNLIDESQD